MKNLKIIQNAHKWILRKKLFAYTEVFGKKLFAISTIEFFNDFRYLANFTGNQIFPEFCFEKKQGF